MERIMPTKRVVDTYGDMLKQVSNMSRTTAGEQYAAKTAIRALQEAAKRPPCDISATPEATAERQGACVALAVAVRNNLGDIAYLRAMRSAKKRMHKRQ